MELSVKSFNLEFHHPFSISRNTYNSQPGVIIQLKRGNAYGFGEATVNPYYQSSEIEMIKEAERFSKLLENQSCKTPDQLWNDLRTYAGKNLFILAAINNASWDLQGKEENKTIRELLNIDTNGELPLTSMTIGIDQIDKMADKMAEKPWPIYKIKLGTSEDMEIVRALRKHSDAVFRVDANAAWTAEETIRYSKELSDLGVEFIEQPLPADDYEGLQKVYKYSALPIVADESCIVEEDVEKCYGLYHGINIKLMKCGGISSGYRMIRKARELNMKIMIGCMAESSIGISAAAQLLSLVDYADLDGPLLIKNDSATGVTYNNGKIELSGKPGLGITVL